MLKVKVVTESVVAENVKQGKQFSIDTRRRTRLFITVEKVVVF